MYILLRLIKYVAVLKHTRLKPKDALRWLQHIGQNFLILPLQFGGS